MFKKQNFHSSAFEFKTVFKKQTFTLLFMKQTFTLVFMNHNSIRKINLYTSSLDTFFSH